MHIRGPWKSALIYARRKRQLETWRRTKGLAKNTFLVSRQLSQNIHPYPKITGSAGDAIENHTYRFNWDSPIHISPHDANTVYFAGNVLFKSSDRGYHWQEISPDLTTNDKNKQRTSGGEIYQDNTAAEFHCSALTIAESPVQAGVIWVGTDDGNIQITLDGGKQWTNVHKNVPGLPAFAWIGKIHASEHDAGTAFVAVDNHRSDDFSPRAYLTTDFGKSWTQITTDLPKDDYVKVVRQDPHDPNILYLGMEHGIYMSWNLGKNWTRINNNLPPVSVRDLRIQPRENDLVVGSHGRGVWILDNISALQHWENTTGKKMHVFQPRPAIRWHMYSQIENLGSRTYTAKNPSYGASFEVFLAEQQKEPVRIEIKDETGRIIRELSDSVTVVGLNRIEWDFGGLAASPLKNPPPAGWNSEEYRAPVAPGIYAATIFAGGQEQMVTIVVQPDPRLNLTLEDYLAQAEALNRLQDLLSQTHAMINDNEALLDQLDASKSRIALKEDADDKLILEQIEQTMTAITKLQNELLRPPPSMTYRQRPRLREDTPVCHWRRSS